MQINTNLPTSIRPETPRSQPQPRAQRPANTPQAEVNFIPSDESLFAKIKDALSNIKRGFYPDRGAILNLLV